MMKSFRYLKFCCKLFKNMLVLVFTVILLGCGYFFMRSKSRRCAKFGFFHPYCNAGGGGERVLWLFVKHLKSKYPGEKIAIYTGDADTKPEEIIFKANKTFQLDLSSDDVSFVFLNTRTLVEAKWYPMFTLLLQSIFSMVLGFEALFKCHPEIFIDTMGYSFTYPIFKYLGRCKVMCYVHYPTISCDMLQTVTSQEASFNNRRFISRSKVLTNLKLKYYQIFAKFYGFMGRHADLVMVNSSWTKGHIVDIWKLNNIILLYPPCNYSGFKNLPLVGRSPHHIVSISQFRPEKNHRLQLESLHLFLKKLSPDQRSKVILYLVGSCRNQEDENRVTKLRNYCKELGIEENIKFKINISFDELLDIVKTSSIGIHTMKNEHFGIGVVEMIAGGLIVVAHESGGPKLDIVRDSYGFLAQTTQEYADNLVKIVNLAPDHVDRLRSINRKAMKSFDDRTFLNQLRNIL